LRAGADQSGAKNSIQAIGSTISYLQRYTLKAALGLAAANDDDGKASGSTEASLTQADIDGLVSLIAETNSNLDLVLTAAKARPFEDGEEPSFADKVARLSEIGRADFDRVRARLLQKKGK
jgi:hypothetical protein